MKVETAKIRNVGLAGHGTGGKTSLAEALLFTAGATNRHGRVEDGTTVLDFDEDEIKRGITISSAVATLEWKGHKVNVLDTPGFGNFLADTKTCLRVVDTTVIVVPAPSGVQVQTDKVWSYATEYGQARVIFLSKMDRERADFARAVEDVRKNLTAKAVPVQIPMGREAGFEGVVDLLRLRAVRYPADGSGKGKEEDVPANLKAEAEAARAALLEAIAEADDQLLEKYLESGELSEAEARAGLRKGLAAGALVPILCGAATRAMAVQPLLDFLVEACPSPADMPPPEAVDPKGQKTPCPATEGGPLAAQVYKTVADPFAGKVTMFRVYSGVFRSDATVLNSSKGVKERIGQVVLLRGKTQTPVEAVVAGDLGAVVKLKETGTGDTLTDEKAGLKLPPLSFPHPVITCAIEPKAKGDEDKMGAGLARLREEDPTLHVRFDPQTRETVISGMGKAHLEVVVERLKRKFGVDVLLKTPRVPYKETIKARVREVQGRHKKQTGGRGQFGDCWIHLEPLPRGGGFEFVNEVVGGAIPRNFIPAVEKGIVETMERGVLAGNPVVDVRVTLYDGSTHSVDSSELAFKLAGRLAFRKAVQSARPTILEPVMHVEVVAPDDCMGAINGDLNGRRGRVLGMEGRGRNQAVKAQVPLAEMLDYDSKLRSLTGDRGDYTMEFSHYDEVPAHLQEKIIAEAKKGQAEEEED